MFAFLPLSSLLSHLHESSSWRLTCAVIVQISFKWLNWNTKTWLSKFTTSSPNTASCLKTSSLTSEQIKSLPFFAFLQHMAAGQNGDLGIPVQEHVRRRVTIHRHRNVGELAPTLPHHLSQLGVPVKGLTLIHSLAISCECVLVSATRHLQLNYSGEGFPSWSCTTHFSHNYAHPWRFRTYNSSWPYRNSIS